MNKFEKVQTLTWKIPGIIFIDIQLLDELDGERLLLNLPLQVKPNQLLISGMKSKPGKHDFLQFISIISLLHIFGKLILASHSNALMESKLLPKKKKGAILRWVRKIVILTSSSSSSSSEKLI